MAGRTVSRAWLGASAVMFGLGCSALNGEYDPSPAAGTSGATTMDRAESRTGPASASDAMTTPGGSQTGGTTSNPTQPTGPETTSGASTSSSDTTDSDTAPPRTDDSSESGERVCRTMNIEVDEDAFLVSGEDDVSFANFGATPEHALYDSVPGQPQAVLLLRIPQIVDLYGADTLHLSVSLRLMGVTGGTLRASLMNEVATCDWLEGSQDGEGAANGVSWARCTPGDPSTWPNETPLDALGAEIGERPLLNLGPPDADGLVSAEFVADVSGLMGVPERSVLVYTSDIGEASVEAFSSDADDDALLPKVWFEACR